MLILLAAVLACLADMLVAAPIIRVDKSQDSYQLGPFLELHRGASVEAAEVLSTADQDWQLSTKVVPSFGMDNHGKASYWVRFQLENPNSEPMTFYLANHYPPTDHLRLYQKTSDTGLILLEEQGDQSAWQRRSVRHRFPVFRLTLPPGTHSFYLEQKSLASIQYPLKLWQPEAFTAFAFHENLMLGGIMGICIFALVYNLFIFLRLKAGVYFLYVLHSLSIGIFLANFLGFTQSVLLPDTDGSWWLNTGAKVNMDIVQLTAITFTMVFLDMKRNAPRWRVWLLCLTAVGVLTLLNTLSWRLIFNTQTALFSMVASLSLFIASLWLSRVYSYARYYAIGWSLLLLLNSVTMLSLFGAVPTDITLISWSQSIGQCFELCLLSLALGERMAWIKRHREETLLELARTKSDLAATEQERLRIQTHLLEEREQNIRDLDRKVEERTRDLRSILNNLNQGIFAIRLDAGRCLMDPDYSPFLHTLLGSFDSQAEDPVELLFRESTVGHDEQSRIRSILVSMIDADRLSFDLNLPALPREIERGLAADERKTLEIDWDPVVDGEGRIQKVLVALRDVTEYRALRQELRTRSEDIIIAQDLLQPDSAAPLSRISQIAEALQKLLQDLPLDTGTILRQLHSLKGDSRTLMLTVLSEAIHEAESVWIQERRVCDKGLKALTHASRLARRYHEIYKAFERRFRPMGSDLQLVSGYYAASLSEILAIELDQLTSLARELKKPVPRVLVADSRLHLTTEIAQGLRECFGHLLRNALDHGLEDAAARRSAGKPEQGLITLDLIEDVQSYDIILRDDGPGLNLNQIRKKAQEKGIKPAAETDEAVAELIFVPELSTRDVATMISGRGIGMDAVRARLEAMDGSIGIELLPGATRSGFRLFQFRLHLPMAERQRKPKAS